MSYWIKFWAWQGLIVPGFVYLSGWALGLLK